MQEHTPFPSAAAAAPRIALLIDAENMSAAWLPQLMALVAQRGNAIIRRAYADWTNQHQASWRKVVEAHVIRPIQQFHYRNGKNATDSALILDAMELLHERDRRVDALCLMSSDSDFTGLVGRYREANLPVFGFGRPDAARSLVSACNAFMFLGAAEPDGAETCWV